MEHNLGTKNKTYVRVDGIFFFLQHRGHCSDFKCLGGTMKIFFSKILKTGGEKKKHCKVSIPVLKAY